MDKKKMIKVAGKIIIKHELKKKIREKVSDGLTSHTGSATAGFVAGAGAAQIDYNQLHWPTAEEVPRHSRGSISLARTAGIS